MYNKCVESHFEDGGSFLSGALCEVTGRCISKCSVVLAPGWGIYQSNSFNTDKCQDPVMPDTQWYYVTPDRIKNLTLRDWNVLSGYFLCTSPLIFSTSIPVVICRRFIAAELKTSNEQVYHTWYPQLLLLSARIRLTYEIALSISRETSKYTQFPYLDIIQLIR